MSYTSYQRELVEIPSGILVAETTSKLDFHGSKPLSGPQQSKLLSLPGDILFSIYRLGILEDVDTACLKLTCKLLARFIENARSKPIKDTKVMRKTKYAPPSPPPTIHASPVKAPSAQSDAHKLFLRLDLGWNRSNSRACYSCGTFRSLDPVYWAQRDKKHMCKKIGRLADAWKTKGGYGGSTSQGYISQWLGDHRERLSYPYLKEFSYDPQIEFNDAGYPYLLCPECAVQSPRHQRPKKLKFPTA